MQQRSKPIREKINTYTILSCVNKDHEEKRDFVPGDYVGKIVQNKTCPKCGSELYIKTIYSEKIREKTQ
jgi:predicted nucleic-acid-binding Zn-ribbon protein